MGYHPVLYIPLYMYNIYKYIYGNYYRKGIYLIILKIILIIIVNNYNIIIIY